MGTKFFLSRNLKKYVSEEFSVWFRFREPKPRSNFDTDTEIGPWFRFPIPKPGFGRTLGRCDDSGETEFFK